MNVTIDKEEPEQKPVIDLAGAPKPYYTPPPPPPIPCHAPDLFTMIGASFGVGVIVGGMLVFAFSKSPVE